MSRTSLAVLLCLATAVPAAAQITRVSVSTAGVEANGSSGEPSISGDGRFVVFASRASNLVANDANGVEDVFLRDRDTDADGIFDEAGAVATTRLSLGPGGIQTDGASDSPVITPDGRYVAFASAATNLVAGSNAFPQIYRLDRTTNTLIRVSERADGAAGTGGSWTPSISDGGDAVAFVSFATNLTDDEPEQKIPVRTFVRQVTADRTTRLIAKEPFFNILFTDFAFAPQISADGTRVVYVQATNGWHGTPSLNAALVVDVASNTATTFDLQSQSNLVRVQMSADGTALVIGGGGFGLNQIVRQAIATGATTSPIAGSLTNPSSTVAASDTGRLALAGNARLVDFNLGLATPLGFTLDFSFVSRDKPANADFSGNDRWLAIASADSALLPGGADSNNDVDVFVIDLPDFLDADDDTMDDRWETLYGVTDPMADPDGDGQTNAQEEDAGTHPNGQLQRFLAEGATGRFFHTAIALANPNPTLPAAALLTFDRGNGTRVRQSVSVPAGRSVVVNAGAVAGLEFADVSTTVESDRFVAVERSMTWGTDDGAIYGSHAETATPTPSPTWFLAEGSTVLGFDLFYLLQNPQATTAHATVNFLLPSGTTISRTYTLAPGSRTTIYVNQVEGLDETDVSGGVSADAPIVVERAMYRSLPGQPFALGTESMGVPAAATSWFLAEGATGAFFDLYVLIANPGATDASVTAQYSKPDGTVVTQTYTVRAHSRFSVYVDSIPGLENTAVATTLTSTNGVPIVAERAMYWPGGFFDYYEGHSSAGSTTTALEWVVSGGENGGADAVRTFVLIANTASTPGEATLTVLPDRGFTGPAPPPALMVVALPANSRTTVPITALDGTFGVRVVSTGAVPVPLVVESAVYRSAGGVIWSAGSNALATPVVP